MPPQSKIRADQVRLSSDGGLQTDTDGDGELRIKVKQPVLLSGVTITEDGMSISTNGMDIASSRLTFGYQKSLGTNGSVPVYSNYPSQSGSRTDVLDADGSWVGYSSGNANGSTGGLDSPNYNLFELNCEPILRIRMKTGSNITNQRIWVGMCSSSISGSDNPTASLMAFRYSTATDTQFVCCVKDGTTMTTFNSGVTISANTPYDLVIDASQLTSCSFFINDQLITTISSNMPTPTTNIGVTCKLTNLTASSRLMYFSRMIGSIK